MRPRCVVAANASPGLGGQGINLRHVIDALRNDFDLTVFARGTAEGLASQVVPESRLTSTINRVPVVRRLRDWGVLASEVHFDRCVATRLPATPLFHGAGGQCLRSLGVARSRGARTLLDVVTLHADAFAQAALRECARFGVRFPLRPALVDRMRQEYQVADRIRVMSERARATFLERGVRPERVVTVLPPLDLTGFPEARFPQAKFRVSCVGLLEPWKGFHYLVEAFGGLKDADAELVLWGAPGSRPVSRYLAERRAADPRIAVRPMQVGPGGFAEVYGRSSVVVHPSVAEGFGLVVAEAMACGVPVIVTDRTGAADLVQDGVNGFVVGAGDSGAILERLDHLARHPALVQQMGAAARETMRAQTPEAFRLRYVELLRSLLA